MIDVEREYPHRGASPAWGHMIGALSLHPPSPEPDPGGDSARLMDLATRFAWAMDERRVDILAECLTVSAVWEGSVEATDELGPIEGRRRILDWLAGLWQRRHGQQRHFLMNALVEHQDQDQATVLCYFLVTDSRAGKVALETTGFQRLDAVREHGTWRIDRLFTGFDAPFWPRGGELHDRERHRYGLFAGRE